MKLLKKLKLNQKKIMFLIINIGIEVYILKLNLDCIINQMKKV